jgi:hypothetical protein
MIINTTLVYFSLERISIESLEDKIIEFNQNGLIKFPSNLNLSIDVN